MAFNGTWEPTALGRSGLPVWVAAVGMGNVRPTTFRASFLGLQQRTGNGVRQLRRLAAHIQPFRGKIGDNDETTTEEERIVGRFKVSLAQPGNPPAGREMDQIQ